MPDYQNMTPGEHEIGWDDTIQNDSVFSIVPEGDYNFIVKKFERGRHNGPTAENPNGLPPCNKAILTIEVSDGAGHKTTIIHNLFLHSRTEGMVCAFFTAIGQRKVGEPLKPNWNQVIGSTGTCKVIKDEFKTKNGGKSENNKISRFYAKGDPDHPPIQEQPTYGAVQAAYAPVQQPMRYQPQQPTQQQNFTQYAQQPNVPQQGYQQPYTQPGYAAPQQPMTADLNAGYGSMFNK